MFGIQQGIATLNAKFIVVDIVEEHVHTSQVIGGHIDFLTIKTIFDDMLGKLFLGLKEERTRATGRVINFIDLVLLIFPKHDNLGQEF